MFRPDPGVVLKVFGWWAWTCQSHFFLWLCFNPYSSGTCVFTKASPQALRIGPEQSVHTRSLTRPLASQLNNSICISVKLTEKKIKIQRRTDCQFQKLWVNFYNIKHHCFGVQNMYIVQELKYYKKLLVHQVYRMLLLVHQRLWE